MDALPMVGTPVLLELEGVTWRLELVASVFPDARVLRLALGEMPPLELMRLEKGRRVACRFHEGQILGAFEGRVAGVVKEDGRAILELDRPASISRSPRRKHVRVNRHVAMKLRLPLRNEALGRALGKDFTMLCWVQATAVNISAGGVRVVLELPRHHSAAPHREAVLRFDLSELHIHDRKVNLVRRDWSTGDTVMIYTFVDLSPEEVQAIEAHNMNWLGSVVAVPAKEPS
jgi:hypothetical protein